MLAACGGGEPPPPAIPDAPPPIAAEPAGGGSGPTTVSGAEGAVPVEIQFFGVSPLYKDFFSQPKVVGPLGTALGSCLSERAVVQVSYNEDKREGFITLVAEPKTMRCKTPWSGEVVDLSPLAPLGQGIAAYRDAVAAAYDFRVASFGLRLELRDAKGLCRLDASGQHPPTGESWSPCVELNGVERCFDGKKGDGRTSLTATAETRRVLAACLP